MTVVVGERPISRAVTVTPAADGRPTYVEFILGAGTLEAASWLGGVPTQQSP